MENKVWAPSSNVLELLLLFSYILAEGDWVTDDCVKKERQSPITIDLDKVEEKKMDSDLSVPMGAFEKKFTFSNTWHNVEFVPESGALLLSGGGLEGMYELKGLHIHWGCSEHKIKGHEDMFVGEIHWVHGKKGADNNPLAVLGVFLKKGQESSPGVKFIIEGTDYHMSSSQ